MWLRSGILVPILVILLFFWSYYVYIFEVCMLKISSVLKLVLYLAFFNLCALSLTLHYFAVMFIQTDPVPENYQFTFNEFETLHSLNPDSPEIRQHLERFCASKHIRTFSRKNGCIRYCMKCRLVKPDRTHHCSTCRRCILKMDHHCPWVYNCVGFGNYKLFLLLLVHAMIYCLYYTCTTLEFVVGFFRNYSGGLLREIQYIVLYMFIYGWSEYRSFLFVSISFGHNAF